MEFRFPRPQQVVLERYAAAFETADIAALNDLLADDVTCEMPPDPTWFAGRGDVAGFLAAHIRDHGGIRTIPTAANGQPAFALYARQDGRYCPHALHVLTLAEGGVSRIVAFSDPRLFPLFGMPPEV